MDVVKEILSSLGIASVETMDLNESYTIEVTGYEDLTIEKIGGNQISVAHHHIQRGDLMCDPEVVFDIRNGKWVPIEYTQHPMVYQHDENGLNLDGFLNKWDANLRNQGFLEAAGGEAYLQG